MFTYNTFISFLILAFTLWSMVMLFKFMGLPVAIYSSYILWFVMLILFYVFLPRKSSVFID